MIDTHCHIHSRFFPLDLHQTLRAARQSNVEHMICVGVDAEDSRLAVELADKHDDISATIGIHPHEAADSEAQFEQIRLLAQKPNIIAIGEIGLDYWYQNSPKDAQIELLKKQLELGTESKLPFTFHVRGSKDDPHDAFEDFFTIIDQYESIKGVVHSFTAGQKSLEGVLSRSLVVGVNGIATFSKDAEMRAAYKSIPLSSMVLETDAPYLTPVPKRGMVNSPSYMGYTAKFMAELRRETIEELIAATNANARALFGLE